MRRTTTASPAGAANDGQPLPARTTRQARRPSPNVGEEPWAETNAADTTLETKDEQNNPPKRGRRRQPPRYHFVF